MKDLSWNVRRLGRAENKIAVRNLVYNFKPGLLFVQESKLSIFYSKVIKSLRGSLLTKGVGVEVRGSAGGINTLWNDDLFEAKDCITNDHCVIVSAQVSLPGPWVVGGDFNTVLSSSERRGGAGNSKSMENFYRFSQLASVVDIPLQAGPKRTEKAKDVKIYLNAKSKQSVPHEKQIKTLEEDLAEIDKKALIRGWSMELRQERSHNHFKKGRQLRPTINGIILKQISGQDNLSLEAAFSYEEVWIALNNCDGNKAPGPDGFNLNFIKKNWEIIKDDFMIFLHKFSSNGAVVKNLNHTFLVFIPKTKNLESLHDYMPISLIGSLYKVLAKVLANRLKLLMNSAIGPTRMAFVKVLAKRLIKWCINSPTMSVLVNGSPTMQFPLEKGLRQGDPLSPFLFNLVVEVLCNMLDKAKDLGMIKGGNPTRESFLRPIIANVENRLAHWKRGFLSKGGRLVLIKVVLSSLPTYFMSIFRIPEGVAKRIEKHQRRFFWNDGLIKKKMHVVDWVSLCKSKKQGGLGISRMIDKGLSFIAKWLWRFRREDQSLWKIVLCVKYGLNPSLIFLDGQGVKNGSYFFKAVSSLLRAEHRAFNIIKIGFQAVCGNGERLRLWHYIVWDSVPLKGAVPRIFTLSSNKEGAIKEFGLKKLNQLIISSFCTASPGNYGLSACNGGVSQAAQTDPSMSGQRLGVVFVDRPIGTEPRTLCFSLLYGRFGSERCVDKENFSVVKHNEWTPPIGNALFFNVDGSARGCPGEAGIGGALRDAIGKILLLFSYYLGIMDSCSDEVHAILKACQLVSSNRSLLMCEDFGHLPVAHLVYNIRNFIQDMAMLEIFFKPRALNSLDDSLIKEGSANQGDRLQWGPFDLFFGLLASNVQVWGTMSS
ncbi:hypothetical protein Ddye_000937 [Dipteronia dyeriana]|uniref:Endonuclease/exonuclease/phosphatase domain-containing protein n=1 Tax=Dipteronia dyeriana TaxID=168575 RepID=A0AAD9XNY8_9ROSI|nr:hypothetical protein Ddye_000937 [Dipteronia dyeriana]